MAKQPEYQPASHTLPPAPAYSITRKLTLPPSANPRDPWWSDVPALHIDSFFHASSRHHPPTAAKLAYTEDQLHVLFQVHDRFVRATHSKIHSDVWKDSCVELFIRPRPELPFNKKGGYFNFEINCCGIPLCYYIENPLKVDGKLTKFTPLAQGELRKVAIYPSIQSSVPFDHPEPLDWSLQYSIPIDILEKYVGKLRPLAGQTWQANLLKCADETRYPHYASWSPIGHRANFHQPDRFGSLYFRQL